MTITQNPHLVIQRSLTGPTLSPKKFFEFAEQVSQDTARFVPDKQTAEITLTGDLQVTGPLSDELRKEIDQLDEGLELQILQFDIRGPGNKPRVLIQVQPGLRTITVNYQHIPASINRTNARGIINDWINRLNGPSVMATPLPRESTTPPSTNAEPGVMIDRYRLVQRLGRGFSAEVWKAEVVDKPPGVNLDIGREIAIKLYTRLSESSSDTIRIQREFQVAISVSHPNLVKVYDLVLSPSRPLHNFLVMELVTGRTLKSLIPSRGMDVQRIVPIARQLFEALTVLHVRDALHRDVKPANIMIVNDGTREHAKLCDLGIVSVMAEPSMTGTSVFLGSKHSAPLEQMTGQELDARTDVYAAGCTMFHCYAGRPMYHRSGPEGAIVLKMLNDPERLSPRTKEPLDVTFVEIVNRCISVEPADRPATATEVVSLLAQLP